MCERESGATQDEKSKGEGRREEQNSGQRLTDKEDGCQSSNLMEEGGRQGGIDVGTEGGTKRWSERTPKREGER